MDEKCIQVTEHDEFIAEVDKLAVHRHQARRHRAISVWGFTSKHEVLLQQRSAKKIVGAGWWANTVCGNVWAGESYQACAVRRLRGELGLKVSETELISGQKFEYKAYCNEEYGEHEVDQIFMLSLPDTIHEIMAENPDEVANTLLVPWSELHGIVTAAVADRGYYTPESSVAATWNELAENMQPLTVRVGTSELLLAPWTVMMIIADLVSIS